MFLPFILCSPDRYTKFTRLRTQILNTSYSGSLPPSFFNLFEVAAGEEELARGLGTGKRNARSSFFSLKGPSEDPPILASQPHKKSLLAHLLPSKSASSRAALGELHFHPSSQMVIKLTKES